MTDTIPVPRETLRRLQHCIIQYYHVLGSNNFGIGEAKADLRALLASPPLSDSAHLDAGVGQVPYSEPVGECVEIPDGLGTLCFEWAEGFERKKGMLLYTSPPPAAQVDARVMEALKLAHAALDHLGEASDHNAAPCAWQDAKAGPAFDATSAALAALSATQAATGIDAFGEQVTQSIGQMKRREMGRSHHEPTDEQTATMEIDAFASINNVSGVPMFKHWFRTGVRYGWQARAAIATKERTS